MNKRAFITLCFYLFVSMTALAQKKDTTFFYIDYGDNVTAKKENASFIRYVYSPGAGDTLYLIKDFYKNGKPKLVTHSTSGNAGAKNTFEGEFVEYFDNGNKKTVGIFHKSQPVGEYTEYYTNGKLYCNVIQNADGLYLKACRDSTGKILATNGKGKWIKYTPGFGASITGKVANGKEEGEWTGKAYGTITYKNLYKNGEFKGGDIYFKNGQTVHITQLWEQPGFIGGDAALGKYISKNIVYPVTARESNVEGRVILAFYIEPNGAITNVRVLRGIGSGCDEEAVRVIANSPKWRPGTQNGIPVRVQFAVPIAYSLSK